MLSSSSCSLGIAAPHDIFEASQLDSLIQQARANASQTAIQFSNGNPKLAKGIKAQLDVALDLYQKGKELPLELNIGVSRDTISSPCLTDEVHRAWLYWYDICALGSLIMLIYCLSNLKDRPRSDPDLAQHILQSTLCYMLHSPAGDRIYLLPIPWHGRTSTLIIGHIPSISLLMSGVSNSLDECFGRLPWTASSAENSSLGTGFRPMRRSKDGYGVSLCLITMRLGRRRCYPKSLAVSWIHP